MNGIRYFLLIFLVSAVSCRKNKRTFSAVAPTEINKRIVISEKCNKLAYSSNEFDYFSPVIIDNISDNKIEYPKITRKPTNNSFPFSFSCDCKYVSIASEQRNGKFRVEYLDLNNNKLIAIPSQELSADNGSPFFSPNNSLIAFLSDGALKLYNYNYQYYLTIKNDSTLKFTNLIWNQSGKGIYLQDLHGDIWLYELYGQRYSILFQSSQPFTTNRLISPTPDDQTFYFISDHESQFNQIYKYTKGRLELAVNSAHDKYLEGRFILNDNLVYRENVNGYLIAKKVALKKSSNLSLMDEVVYDYFSGDDYDIYIGASLNQPAALFRRKKIKSIPDYLSEKIITKPIPKPEEFYNQEGMVNYIYSPIVKTKSWMLWLHGGPYEQVSVRYNMFVNTLVAAGYGVVVLNYPGSTGIGNEYELRELSSEMQLDVQIKRVKRDLNEIELIHPEINKLAVLGNSYGSIIAQNLAADQSFKMDKLIDFSGLYSSESTKNKHPTLYLYGENDFSLTNSQRVRFLEIDGDRKGVDIIKLKNEGHVITRKSNNKIVINSLLNFMAED